MNLDKLLKKIEKNKATENETRVFPLEIGGDTFDVKTFTRSEKRDFILERQNNDMQSAKEVVKWATPYIYRCLGLSTVAERAKDNGLIVKYHDVVNYLFEPDEIMEIILFIVKINEIGKYDAEEEVEDIKKQ